jgi:hypothetical protein
MDPERLGCEGNLTDLLDGARLGRERGRNAEQFGAVAGGDRQLHTGDQEADDNRTGHTNTCSHSICVDVNYDAIEALGCRAMPEPTEPLVDPADLGALLVVLHGAGESIGQAEVAYRVWWHHERQRAAFVADIEEQKRRGGVSFSSFGGGKGRPEPAEVEETVRIWRDGERRRVEHHDGDRDGFYAVADPPLWWMWDERNGAHSNEDDPSVGGGVGDELQIMLNPVSLLSALRFEPTGSSEIAGRPTISALGIPRPQNTRHGPAFELNELGTGADFYELEVDRQLGALLAVTAVREKQPFHTIRVLTAEFNQPISDELFRFEPPAGQQIQTRRRLESRVEHVTLVEAQQQAPFTVLMPDTVPASWQVTCRLIRPSERPPSPMQIGLIYRSVDGHESISLSQFPAGGSNPYRELGGEGWETVTRNGIELKTRPARWGQAQVELERDGTFVHLMSDNLTRDQVLTIAAALRPAPSTSGI